MYWDGSKMDNGTGATFYIPQTSISFKYRLSKYIYNYNSEVIAILKAIQYIKSMINFGLLPQ